MSIVKCVCRKNLRNALKTASWYIEQKKMSVNGTTILEFKTGHYITKWL